MASCDKPRIRIPRHYVLLILLLATLGSTGCVRRRLTVMSNPPGASVFVDNQNIGKTPCSIDFTYYGTREIRLIKSGYETLTINQPIPAPWYQVPPLDFISDNFWPIPIRDNRTVAYDMQPQRLRSVDEILARAGELRGQMQGGVVPASAEGSGLPVLPPPEDGGAFPLPGLPEAVPTPQPGSLPAAPPVTPLTPPSTPITPPPSTPLPATPLPGTPLPGTPLPGAPLPGTQPLTQPAVPPATNPLPNLPALETPGLPGAGSSTPVPPPFRY